jgi:hypothetical protein
LAQRAIYEKLPQPLLHLRVFRRKAKKSKSPRAQALVPAAFGGAGRFSTHEPQAEAPSQGLNSKLRDPSQRSKRSRKAYGLENHGLVAIDESKAQNLVDRMTSDDMTLEKYRFKMHRQSNPQNRKTSRKSTAGGDSSIMNANPYSPNQAQGHLV